MVEVSFLTNLSVVCVLTTRDYSQNEMVKTGSSHPLKRLLQQRWKVILFLQPRSVFIVIEMSSH